jgi:hypothetical protein
MGSHFIFDKKILYYCVVFVMCRLFLILIGMSRLFIYVFVALPFLGTFLFERPATDS